MTAWVWLWVLAAEALLVSAVPIVLGRRTFPYAAVLLALLAGISYDLIAPDLVGLQVPLAYVLAAALPLGLVGIAKLAEERPWSEYGFRVDSGAVPTILGVSAVVVGAYLLVTLEGGLVTGFVPVPAPDVASFTLFFLVAPLLALGQEALFRGYLLTRLSDSIPFRTGLFLSALLFAAYFVDPRSIFTGGASSDLQAFFVQVLPMFALGIFCGLFLYKTRWSLLGGVSVRTGLYWAALMLPIAAGGANWLTTFVFELLAIGGMIVIVELSIQEPLFLRRRYLDEPLQPKRRTLIAGARERRETAIALGALGVTIVVVLTAAPVLSGEGPAPFHLYAIASGSMVPTFYRGELVLIRPVGAPADLSVGEIIAYDAPYLSTEGPVVHRIVHIARNGTQFVFTTKGDANPSPDPRPVNFSQVVGAFVGGVPVIGYLILSPSLLAAVVSVVFLVAIFRTSPASRRVRPRPILPRPSEGSR
jgi:signal peptidase I